MDVASGSQGLFRSRKSRILEYIGLEEVRKAMEMNRENDETFKVTNVQVIPKPAQVVANIPSTGITTDQQSFLTETPPKRTLIRPTAEEFELSLKDITIVLDTGRKFHDMLVELGKQGFEVHEDAEVAFYNSPVKIEAKVPDPPPSAQRLDFGTENVNESPDTGTEKRDDEFPLSGIHLIEKVMIGPKGTLISKEAFASIDWSQSVAAVTRKLLTEIFGREMLATHSMSGKASPAFLDSPKPVKRALDASKVSDIIELVMRRKNVDSKQVRVAITSKCADEQKRSRILEEKKSKNNVNTN